jgi:endonuclease/exonuclease/phosphatase family metal-dependent hydrolase
VPAPPPEAPRLKVLTQNVYLGASLLPAITAVDAAGFVEAVEQIYDTVVATDFQSRAGALADMLARELPDVIGLQEVARWTVVGPAGAAPPGFDLLKILESAIAARGLRYDVAAISYNADIDGIPLGDCTLHLQNRDVVLVRADRGDLGWSEPRTGRYRAQQVISTPVGAPMSFDRGWASVEVAIGPRRLRFVDTHLEVEQYAEPQQAQVEELVAGPANTSGPVILVGDLNSAADGSTTTSYPRLLAAGFADTWSFAHGSDFTCCQQPDLGNAASALAARIDFVLARGPVDVVEAHLVGDRPYRETVPLWPSDHAGVVATLALR